MSPPTESTSVELVEQLRHSLHELNNALTPILANAQLARVMIDPSAIDAAEALDDVVDAAVRANKLVAELRDIAKGLQEAVGPGDAPTSETSHG